MRGIVDHASLKNAVALVQGIAQTKISNPIVVNTVIRIDTDHLEVLATNLSVSIRIRMPVENPEPGEVALPAKLLAQLAREIPPGPVNLASTRKGITIKAGRSSFDLCSMATDDFPPFVPVIDGPVIEIPVGVASRAIERTVFTASDERSRFQLGGVLFSHQAGKVTWVATDGRRLSRVVHEIENTNGPSVKMLIPARALQELLRALPAEGTLRITAGEKRVLFDIAGITVASTLLEDNFPPYQSLIPEKYGIQITVDRDELVTAVRCGLVMANERSRLVELDAANGVLVVTGERMEAGGAVSEIDAETGEHSAKVSYNANYLLECLRVMDSGRAVWSLAKDGGPAFLSNEEDPSFLHVIMPMAIREDENRPAPAGSEEDEMGEEDEEE